MRGWHRGCLAVGLALALAGPACAQDALSIAQARAAAVAAHRAQNAPLARGLSLALLERDPKDPVARMVLASSLYAMGRYPAAARQGRNAYRDAPPGPRRHDAAMIVAESEFKAEHLGMARVWLRRAAYHAEDQAQKALALRAFHGLENRQRLSWRVNASMSPVSNLNGGTLAERVTLGPFTLPVPGQLQALSGVQANLGAELGYRFAETATGGWRAGAALHGVVNQLSDAAQRKAPLARGSDYDFWSLEATLLHRAKPAGWRAPWDMRLTAGHNRYGGAELSNYLGASFGKEFILSPRAMLRGEIGTQRQFRLDTPGRSATANTLGLHYLRQSPAGALHLSTGLTDTHSDARAVAFRGGEVTLAYSLAAPVFGAQWQGEVGFGLRDYDSGREDRKLSAGISAVVPGVQYMGFAPELGLTLSRNRSNQLLYDSREVGFTLQLKSVF